MKYLGPFLALLLGACQSMPPPPDPQRPAEMHIATPFFPQQDYQCGPAALATILGWAGEDVDDQMLVDEVWLPERRGSLAIELVAAARARGKLVYPIDTPIALFAALDNEQPVLVLQNLALERWPRWHFAVVTGYRDAGRTIVLNSDVRESLAMHWNRFVRTWARARYQGWLILPAGELPDAAQPLPLVRALNELETSTGATAAAPFWSAAAARFADDYLVQFGYGNHLWSTHQRYEAIEAFRAATRTRPGAHAGWHNLITALIETGQTDAACEILRDALTQVEDSAQLYSLRERLGQQSSSTCH